MESEHEVNSEVREMLRRIQVMMDDINIKIIPEWYAHAGTSRGNVRWKLVSECEEESDRIPVGYKPNSLTPRLV